MKIYFSLILFGNMILYSSQNLIVPTAVEQNEESLNNNLHFDFQYNGRFDIYDGVNKKSYGDATIDAKGNVRGKSNDTIYLQRIITGLTYKPNDDWTLKASMYDSREWGSSLNIDNFVINSGTADEYTMSFYDEHLELFENYIRRNNLFNTNLTLTLGRQQIGYGDGRIFDLGNWVNSVGQLWDAVHMSYKENKKFVDVWYGVTRTNDPNNLSILDKHRFQGAGLYSHYETSKIKLEPFLAWRNNLYHEVTPESNLYYAGFRLYDNDPGFIYDTTFVKEIGSSGELDVDAFATAFTTGYYFDNKYKVKVNIGLLYGSGDENPNDNKMKTFTTPFGANDGKHFGRMDIIFWSNLDDKLATISFEPNKELFIETAYHHFNLAQANDKWHTFGYQNKNGNSYTHIGDEVDLIVEYKLTSSLDLLGIFSYLYAGDFITENNIAQNNASKTFFQFHYKW